MGKTTKNPMSEDELLSALGLSVGTAEPKEKIASQVDDDLLIDALSSESKSAKRPSVDAARVRAREEQEREKRLRSQEWRRELEQQQMREAAMAAAVERERAELEQRSARPASQAAIPNLGEMRDIEDVATIAEEKRRIADEVERRRLAMQAQAQRRQEEVAAEARNAAEEARRRVQSQESAKQQMAAARFAARNRNQANQPLAAQAMQRDLDPTHQVRANQQPRNMAQAQQASASLGAQPQGNNAPKDSRAADAMRQHPAGYSQDLGKPISAQSALRSEPIPQQQQQQAPASYHQTIVQVEAQQDDSGKKRAPLNPQSRESPLGIVLIVLAVLCVLVAASLLTGLWDISNL